MPTLDQYLAQTRGEDEDNLANAGITGMDMGAEWSPGSYGYNVGFDLGAEIAKVVAKAGQNKGLAQMQNYNQIAEQAKAVALAQRAAQNTALVSASLPTTRRRQPLGFGTAIGVTVAVGAIVTFNIQPLVLFKPKRLVVPAAQGASFAFTIMQVNQRSQMVNANPIPAATYSENSTYAEIDWDACQPQGVIILALQNTSGAAASVGGVIYGEVAI